MKKIKYLALLLSLVCLCLVGCGDSKGSKFYKDSELKEVASVNGSIEIEVKAGVTPELVTIDFELYYDKAPIAVTNFVSLAKSNHYNGLIVHYVGDVAMLLGGYYLGDNDNGEEDALRKDLGYDIAGEIEANGWKKNDIDASAVGTMFMYYNETSKDTANNIFGFVLSENYADEGTPFGKVKPSSYTKLSYLSQGKGTNENIETDNGYIPAITMQIKSVTVTVLDANGTAVELPAPKKVK